MTRASASLIRNETPAAPPAPYGDQNQCSSVPAPHIVLASGSTVTASSWSRAVGSGLPAPTPEPGPDPIPTRPARGAAGGAAGSLGQPKRIHSPPKIRKPRSVGRARRLPRSPPVPKIRGMPRSRPAKRKGENILASTLSLSCRPDLRAQPDAPREAACAQAPARAEHACAAPPASSPRR